MIQLVVQLVLVESWSYTASVHFGPNSVDGTPAEFTLQFTGKGGFLSGLVAASNSKKVFLCLLFIFHLLSLSWIAEPVHHHLLSVGGIFY